jgi:UDP-N-acetylmuramate: L-alanyl-gamma-D-glutamyl-meso-diaminopimelate ligase
MDAADTAIVYFSHHALELKGLPRLDPAIVKKYFDRKDIVVIDDKDELQQTVTKFTRPDETPVFLLLMSSGTFDGIDWNNVSSQQNS